MGNVGAILYLQFTQILVILNYNFT